MQAWPLRTVRPAGEGGCSRTLAGIAGARGSSGAQRRSLAAPFLLPWNAAPHHQQERAGFGGRRLGTFVLRRLADKGALGLFSCLRARFLACGPSRRATLAESPAFL